MVSIEVVTEPLGAEVTWDGEIKGISPITIEVELPKTIGNFRDECIGKCGKVDGYLYLPICEWDVLRWWLESGFIGEHWWDLTDDERWCIAYKTASMESSDEISKYNLPLYDVAIEPEAVPINAIQIKEIITTIDGWLFFSPREPEITPVESDMIPDGSIISIFDGVGDKIVEIDLSYLWLQILRDECLIDDMVVCSLDVLEEWLTTGKVGRLWWNLTDGERYSIVDMAVKSWTNTTGKYIHGFRSGEENCDGGTGEWSPADCKANALIRCIKFGDCEPSTNSCYYGINRGTDEEVCYCDDTYHLPTYMVACVTPMSAQPPNTYGHSMAAIRIGTQLNDPNSYYIFHVGYDIQIGDPQLPIHSYDELFIILDRPTGITRCVGYIVNNTVVWHFINGVMV